jgi:probable rRNA maturation factor
MMTIPATDANVGPALDLGLVIEAPAWRGVFPDLELRVQAAVRAAIAGARADSGGPGNAGKNPGPRQAAAYEMGLVFSDDARLTELNAAYRGKEGPTNVLAFENAAPPPKGAPWQLGDVIIALTRTRAEAAAAGLDIADHAVHLVVHGVLHLFGYDHENDTEAQYMEALEVRVLSGLGIVDPYRDGAQEKCENDD